MTRSLAAAQTIPVRGDVDANVEAHLRLVDVAADQQASVLVFPELSLTGYELDLASDLAFTAGDSRLCPLAEAAARHDMTVIAGAPVRLESGLHIGAFVLAPDRSVELYTKQHLGAFPSSASADGVVPPAEASVFEPGALNPIVLFDGHEAAVAICADVGRASHADAAAERGAGTYLASMFVIRSEHAGEMTRLEAIASRHGMAVVFANYGGPSGGLAAGGGSAIWSETGELLARLDGLGAGLVIANEAAAGWSGRTLRLPEP